MNSFVLLPLLSLFSYGMTCWAPPDTTTTMAPTTTMMPTTTTTPATTTALVTRKATIDNSCTGAEAGAVYLDAVTQNNAAVANTVTNLDFTFTAPVGTKILCYSIKDFNSGADASTFTVPATSVYGTNTFTVKGASASGKSLIAAVSFYGIPK